MPLHAALARLHGDLVAFLDSQPGVDFRESVAHDHIPHFSCKASQPKLQPIRATMKPRWPRAPLDGVPRPRCLDKRGLAGHCAPLLPRPV